MMGVVLGLEHHLQFNHYPPVPLSMVPVCEQAIAEANDNGDPYMQIDLPEGITYKGATAAPAYAIIGQHHLDAFIEQGEPT